MADLGYVLEDLGSGGPRLWRTGTWPYSDYGPVTFFQRRRGSISKRRAQEVSLQFFDRQPQISNGGNCDCSKFEFKFCPRIRL